MTRIITVSSPVICLFPFLFTSSVFVFLYCSSLFSLWFLLNFFFHFVCLLRHFFILWLFPCLLINVPFLIYFVITFVILPAFTCLLFFPSEFLPFYFICSLLFTFCFFQYKYPLTYKDNSSHENCWVRWKFVNQKRNYHYFICKSHQT
jgi:hypothetical protein